ncbi:MAG: Hsp20 family protein [Candidatus Coatesbacteria bacterium]|nr:Hsp20 family protein [Candidatus Coatesbacteria bacterium]
MTRHILYRHGDGWSSEHPFPALDVIELADGYLVLVELAGMEPDEVEVTVHERWLIITGDRRPVLPNRARKLLRMEMTHGPFRRELQLPVDADTDSVSAGWKQGLLQISIPRRNYRGLVEIED